MATRARPPEKFSRRWPVTRISRRAGSGGGSAAAGSTPIGSTISFSGGKPRASSFSRTEGETQTKHAA